MGCQESNPCQLYTRQMLSLLSYHSKKHRKLCGVALAIGKEHLVVEGASPAGHNFLPISLI